MAINYFAVVLAALAALMIGSVWYSPAVFGRQWMRVRGFDPASQENQSFPKKLMVMQFIASLCTAFVLALFANALGISTLSGSFELGFFVWLGFLAPNAVGAVLWEGRPWSQFALTGGNLLVTSVVMSIIVGLWH